MNGFNLDESLLLKQYQRAKDTQIERLLTQYGSSLSHVREMYPQLVGAIQQRQLTTALATQPMFFTSTEAAEMGLGIGEDWMLKFTPVGGNGGYTSSLITPEKWEIAEGDLYISPTGEQYTRADLEALLAMPAGDLAGKVPSMFEPLTVTDLTEEGQRLYEEYKQAGGELGIKGWLELREQEYLETEEVFGRVFPEQDIAEVLSYIETDPEGFLADLREIGWTAETEALLRAVVPEITHADLQELFSAVGVPEYIPESWWRDKLWDPLYAGAHAFGYGIKQAFTTILPAVLRNIATLGPDEPQFGGIPQEEVAGRLKAAGEKGEQTFLRLIAENDAWVAGNPQLTPKPEYLESPFENPALFRDPGYYAYSFTNSLAYSLSVMGTIVAVSAVAGPGVGIPAALLLAGGPEASSMTEELVKQGVPFEEAVQWGSLYGLAAGGIETASDLPFLGLIFKPIQQITKPLWTTILRGTASRLGRAILTGLVITQTEGIEEILTQVTHNAILKHYDESQSILEGVSHAYIQGVIASLPFGAIGGGASFTTFRSNLSEQTGQRYDAMVSEWQDAGLTKQQAQVQAVNELAKNPEAEAELSKAIEAAQEEYLAEQGPAPAPVIPELAEDILQEMRVAEEMAKRVTPITPEVTEIDQIVADLNLLREEQVWIDTFKTKGASIIHLQTRETATIIKPPQTIYPFASYEERAMQIKWADGSEMVVDSAEFGPSALQESIAEITHGKPIPEFPEAVTPEVTPVTPELTAYRFPKVGDRFVVVKSGAIFEFKKWWGRETPRTMRADLSGYWTVRDVKTGESAPVTTNEVREQFEQGIWRWAEPVIPTAEVVAPEAAPKLTQLELKVRVIEEVKDTPEWTKLIRDYRAFEKRLHQGRYDEAAFNEWVNDPDNLNQLLTAESGVMNARSSSAKTLKSDTDAVIKRAGLTRKPPGQFRGADSPDWDAYAEKQGYKRDRWDAATSDVVYTRPTEAAPEVPMTWAMTFDQFKETLGKVIAETKQELKATKEWVADKRMQKRMKTQEAVDDRLLAEEVARVEALKDRLPTLEEMFKNPEEYYPRLQAEFPNIYHLLLDRGRSLGLISRIPKAAPGMPEAGLQPSMLEEVPAKEVRPVPTGKLVQSRLDDYLRLREYNAKAVTDRISDIKKLLETKGRLAKGLGLKGNLVIELARLEALQELDAIESVEELDRLIEEVATEIGNRSLPFQGYGGKSHIDLLRHPSRRPFKGYATKQLEEMMKVYEQARQRLSPEVPATSVIKAGDIPTDIPALTSTALSAKQVQRTIDLFKEAIAAPNIETQRAAAIELRKHVLAQRATLAHESAEAMIAEGMNPEEAIKVAEQQFMAGKLPDVTTEYFSDLTQEMRNVLFAKVHNYWKDKSWFELISTFEALTNALAGKSIPRVKGIGTQYFPQGGSAWDRLATVFIGDMPVLELIDQGKPLQTVIEGVLLETGRGSVSLDQRTVDWLKSLSTITAEDRLLLDKPLTEITEVEVGRIAQTWFYRRREELQGLLKEGVITQVEYKLQLALAKDRVFPHRPITLAGTYPGVAFAQPRLGEVYSPIAALPEARTEEQIRLAMFELEKKYREGTTEPRAIAPTPDEWGIYNQAFKEVPLLTFKEKHTIVRTLKSLGMAAIDIGNLIRANKASFDFSFWRQAKALAAGHPVAFYRANIEAWKALWSQASAEANWQWITRDPDFDLYEQIRQTTGADPLRILEAPKGTVQWRAAEEFGYLTGERAIPRFTGRIPWIKVSGRSFVAGTNTMSWLVWKKCLEATRARAMRVASGDIILEEGEAFSIYEEIVDYQKYIADAIQRASLGKAAPLAPALSAMFFAPRSKLARLLYPRHLISSNPRVRALAWKDFSLFVGTISGMVMLGYWLGLWDVERDPRNAEFMSIRLGNMRIDPWAGHRQFVVLYARLVTGTGISSVTGQEYEVNPIGSLTTFFRTSLAPLSSILLDFWTGKNFLGEDVGIANAKQWLDRILPFAIQDVLEAFQDDWQNGLIAILPAIVGEGVQTYSGDWRDNWLKLGLPKYAENTGYGIDEPVYDLADFWADTASALRGVDPATLTESKGYPEYVRSIAQALQIIEAIELLPNRRLASLNADPEEGTTFKQYYQMWQERQRIVASGDEEKLKEFDADERTRDAYLGNMTQAQYALLMEYHSLAESEQADFLGNHPELYSNPREDWLRSHPEENGLLALWNKAKAYSQEALDKISSLAHSLGIPESAMVARDLDAVTQLRLHHKALFDLLDVYGGFDDTITDAEGLTARDRAIQELYTNNPDFRDDMRRIDALGQGTEGDPTPDDIIEGWVDRGRIVDEFGANSAEAKLWLLDNKEVHQWALGHALLSDDGSDWNESIFRLIVEYRDDFDSYDALGDITSDRYISDDDQRAEARHRLLFDDKENMTSFGKAYYTRQASGQGYSESNWNSYVEYSELPLWGSWRERFLLGNADFYKEYTDSNIGNHPLVDKTKVRLVARDKIYQQFYDEFQAWDETGGMAPMAIENMRAGLDGIERGGLTFAEARYSVQAYDNGFPEGLIDDYVGWYSTARKDYEDDWWLMDHPEFYKAMYDLDIWTEPRDFSKVPTREVWSAYQTYLGLPSGTPRYDFRAKHLDLDDWLVLKFGYKPIEERGQPKAEKTPWEELQEGERFKELFK